LKRVDSDALQAINRALGLTGRGAPITEFLDGQLDQVFDVVPSVRRGRTPAATTGIFTGIVRNIHTDAESIATGFNPYTFGTAGLIAPYPNPVPPQFDIWLLGAVVIRVSGGGTLSAILDVQFNQQGFGITDGGVAVVATQAQVLAHWDAFVTEGITFGVQAGSEAPYAKIGMRLPSTGSPGLAFRTTSSLTVTIDLQVTLGLFPASLGQDGAF